MSAIAERRPPTAVRRRRLLESVATHAVLIAVAAAFAMPILIMFFTALMSDQQALTSDLWPDPFVWSNFGDVFSRVAFARDTWNTFLYASLATIGVVVSSVPVAYALARIRWRGRNVVFLLVLATMMLPVQVTTVSLYVIFARHLGWTGVEWVGTLKPLILPYFFGDAFSIFLLRQFFMTIPNELSDAIRVDGGGDFQILWRVIVPLAKPAIAAVALFTFIYAWNDFYGPLIYVGENEKAQTLSLALAQFRNLHAVEWNLTMAAAMLFMLPVIVLFFLAQRVFIEGVTLTGVKG